MPKPMEFHPPKTPPEMNIPMTPAEVKRMWRDRFPRNPKRAALNALTIALVNNRIAPLKFPSGEKKTGEELWDEFAAMNDRSGLVYEWTERVAAPDWDAIANLLPKGRAWPRRAVLEYDCQVEGIGAALTRALNDLARKKRQEKAKKAAA